VIEHGVTEAVVERAPLDWLVAIGWQVAHGPDIAPGMLAAERADYGEVVLGTRLRIVSDSFARRFVEAHANETPRDAAPITSGSKYDRSGRGVIGWPRLKRPWKSSSA
jgi:hypothetical protein